MKQLTYYCKTALWMAVLVSPCSMYGWSQKGHDVVAEIATRHLTPATKAAVDSIFDGKSLVYWSNWLDNASHTPEYDYSLTWHYKNIDADKTFDTAYKNPKGDIVTALQAQSAALKDSTLSKKETALALKMVVHLMGDLHQPMHLGRYTDRGGNKHKVSFFDRETNLHSVWDSSLPEAAHKWSYTEWANQIDDASPALESILLEGDFYTWGNETYEICKEVYATTPENMVISYDYIARWTPVIEQQLLKGGLRLASVLNRIFDSTSTSAK